MPRALRPAHRKQGAPQQHQAHGPSAPDAFLERTALSLSPWLGTRALCKALTRAYRDLLVVSGSHGGRGETGIQLRSPPRHLPAHSSFPSPLLQQKLFVRVGPAPVRPSRPLPTSRLHSSHARRESRQPDVGRRKDCRRRAPTRRRRRRRPRTTRTACSSCSSSSARGAACSRSCACARRPRAPRPQR